VIAYMINAAKAIDARAPPPPQPEVVGVAPSPGYYRADGEWVWNGRTWLWIRG